MPTLEVLSSINTLQHDESPIVMQARTHNALKPISINILNRASNYRISSHT